MKFNTEMRLCGTKFGIVTLDLDMSPHQGFITVVLQ